MQMKEDTHLKIKNTDLTSLKAVKLVSLVHGCDILTLEIRANAFAATMTLKKPQTCVYSDVSQTGLSII